VSERSSGIILDTCAVIWLGYGSQIGSDARQAIERAGLSEGILVSPISAWEIGILSKRARSGSPQFLPDPKTWFAKLIAMPGMRMAPFTPEIAIDASHLPGLLHGDPADRMLIATARHLGFPIVTRDERIRAYAKTGEVGVIAC
jgi:PIN domain nuclease of toxin-antitoxin system